MTAYLVRRTLLAAFTLFVISFVSFLITQIPEGDIVDEYILAIHETRGLHLSLIHI